MANWSSSAFIFSKGPKLQPACRMGPRWQLLVRAWFVWWVRACWQAALVGPPFPPAELAAFLELGRLLRRAAKGALESLSWAPCVPMAVEQS